MKASSSARDSGHTFTPAPSLSRPSSRGHRNVQAFAGEQYSAKLYSVGLRSAFAIVLSVVGLGSAMGQSIDQDMALGANTQATRDRVISEILQARADGTIKRWSPVLLEVPSSAPCRGARFAPFSPQQPGHAPVAIGRAEAPVPLPGTANVSPASAN